MSNPDPLEHIRAGEADGSAQSHHDASCAAPGLPSLSPLAAGATDAPEDTERAADEDQAGEGRLTEVASKGAAPTAGIAPPRPRISRQVTTTHKSSRAGVKIDHIVIHYTSSRNIGGSIRHFQSGKPQTSAHYLIGQDGELVQVVPEADCAWHAGSQAMNRRSIGIEHVAAPGDEITEAQSKTSAALIGYLIAKYDIARANIIPHSKLKPTACCGDLYRAFGGGSARSAGMQAQAIQKWLMHHVVGAEPSSETSEAPLLAEDSAARSQEATVALRRKMAQLILDFEALRDRAGHLAIHALAADDGGGRYEVAGINERYHRAEAEQLAALIKARDFAKAEDMALHFILGFTAPAAAWSSVPAIELCLRDAMFNRGASGAARILQKALGVAVDGKVGPITLGALRTAQTEPLALLAKLRLSREWHERSYAKRDETSRFWRGLVNRWDRLDAAAKALLPPEI